MPPISKSSALRVLLQLELVMEQQTGSRSGKEYVKAVFCHPAYLYAQYIMRNTGLDEAQDEIKIARRNINNLRYTESCATTLMAESKIGRAHV